jgi:hypothetical protein
MIFSNDHLINCTLNIHAKIDAANSNTEFLNRSSDWQENSAKVFNRCNTVLACFKYFQQKLSNIRNRESLPVFFDKILISSWFQAPLSFVGFFRHNQRSTICGV